MDVADETVTADEQGEQPAAARPRRRAKTKTVAAKVIRVPRFSDLGPMPTGDTMAMNAYMHRALGISAAQVLHDPDLNERDRRAQLCDIAGRMSALTPQSRLFEAEKMLKGEADKLAEGNGPEMEPANHEPSDAISPEAGRPKARRGRPRKRGFG